MHFGDVFLEDVKEKRLTPEQSEQAMVWIKLRHRSLCSLYLYSTPCLSNTPRSVSVGIKEAREAIVFLDVTESQTMQRNTMTQTYPT